MKKAMDPDRLRVERLLEAQAPLAGMSVRSHGDHLILGREATADEDRPGEERDDRIRLTRLARGSWGLSVKRHNGRWERTPFVGSLEEMVGAILSFMQHLCAPID